jgi:NAD(P)-dependent dehydrogenase (short-subunit alcohol dehydrogenase family)
LDTGLKDKVALITGAGSQIGFGKAITIALAKEGCHVAAIDIDLKGAKQTAAEARALGRKAIALKLDVANHNETKAVIQAAIAELGRIDILINVAGVCSGIKQFLDTTEADWDFDIGVNLKGVLNCTMAVLPGMIERKFGRIINIVSGAGIIGGYRAHTYSASKAGAIIFTKTIAVEMAPLGININAIAPGFARTGFAKSAPPGYVDEAAKTITIGRLTDVQDIANAAVFFASNLSSDIIGQTLSVSGNLV